MQRSGRILVVCHCLLNANAKVRPLAAYGGAHLEALRPWLEQGVGLFQLPCPETACLGLRRWGMTREQYDHPAFRRACRGLLQPVLDQLAAFAADGCEVVAVVGMDGSPNCGAFATCAGFLGGEVSSPATRLDDQVAALRIAPGRGVFLEELAAALDAAGLDIPFWAVDEARPGRLRTSAESQPE